MRMSYYRPHLTLRISPCRVADRTELLLQRLADREAAPLLFRVMDGPASVALAGELRRRRVPVRVASAETPEEERRKTTAWFHSGERPALVVAEPLPLPKRKDVRMLWWVGMPPSLAAAAEDMAAVGADGLPCEAEVLAAASDVAERERRVRGDFLLFRPLRSSADILVGFDAARAAFLRRVFACAERAGEGVFVVGAERAARNAGVGTKKVRDAMAYLAENGFIETDGFDQATVEEVRTREAKAVADVGTVVGWVESQGCWWSGLLEGVGESFGRVCGHCGWCLGKRPGLLPPEPT